MQRSIVATATAGRRSTGPRTPDGKAASAANATTHGLYARHPVLRDEDPAEYEALRQRLVEHMGPEPGAEGLLVDDIADLVWRLRRLSRVEVALFAVGLSAPVVKALSQSGEGESGVGMAFATQADSLMLLSRYETTLGPRRSCTAAQTLRSASRI